MKTPNAYWSKDGLSLRVIYNGVEQWYHFQYELDRVVTPFQTIRAMAHPMFGVTFVSDTDIMSCVADRDYDDGILMAMCGVATKSVLILGGADGSLARRLHELNFQVTVCEIDSMALNFFAKFMPPIPPGVEIVNEDAFVFAGPVYNREFGIVIDDMFTTPLGCESFYYKKLAHAFKGIPIVSQTDSKLSSAYPEIMRNIHSFAKSVKTCSRFVPVYLDEWTFTRYQV